VLIWNQEGKEYIFTSKGKNNECIYRRQNKNQKSQKMRTAKLIQIYDLFGTIRSKKKSTTRNLDVEKIMIIWIPFL